MTIRSLLQLQNGVEEVLVEEEFPMGDIVELRLILGDDNSVVVNGDTLNLMTPGSQQSGLKIKVNATLDEGDELSILLDFDAEKSVHQAGKSGNYVLRPVLTAILPDGTSFNGDDDEDDDDN